jgi:nucleoside-diphosphate-sugar epimerase
MRQGRPVVVPGDGTSLWVLTWNADFAVGLVGLLGRDDAVGEAFHITSDEVLTWDAIHAEVAGALGVEPRLVHVPSDVVAGWDAKTGAGLLGDKAHSVVFDNSKIRRFVPGFAPRVPFAEGVRRAIAWFEADPARRTIDEEADRTWDAIIAAQARAFPPD